MFKFWHAKSEMKRIDVCVWATVNAGVIRSSGQVMCRTDVIGLMHGHQSHGAPSHKLFAFWRREPMTLFSGLRSEYNLLIEAFEALSAMLAIQLDYLRTHKHKYTFAEIKNLLAVVTALQHEVEIITSDPKFIACSERANLAWQNHKTDFTKCEPSHWKASDDVVSADHVLRTA